MNEPGKINIDKQKHLILISPLDWGLGHTTRCIPIIRELRNLSCEVIVACNSIQQRIIEREFPQITCFHLDGYNIRYGRTRRETLLQVILQIPKMLIAIKSEKRWLHRFLKQYKVDAVISDNRYGFRSNKIPSILITHQPGVLSGSGQVMTRILRHFLKQWIEKFDECWIPDYRGERAIAGVLSNPPELPQTKIQYLGCLSRLDLVEITDTGHPLLIILSGPEPQRSIFENRIFEQLKKFQLRAIVIRGLPEDLPVPQIPDVTIYNHADRRLLNQLICNAEWVICRSGYTSVMDLLKLQKKMILVPTPGQPEQEYLAKRLQDIRLSISFRQDEFLIPDALAGAIRFSYAFESFDMELYKEFLKKWITELKIRN